MRKLTATALCTLVLAACNGGAGDAIAPTSTPTSIERTEQPMCPTEGEILETAKLYIEHNATDADTGVHGVFGGEAWSELCLWDPDGNLIFFIDPQSQLDDLTVADLFFESREPPNDEYTLDDLRADFPEGTYVAGVTGFDGVARIGSAVFTHAIPAEPVISSPSVGDEGDPPEVPIDGLTVSWEAITATISGDPVTVTGYEVILTKVDHDDPAGLSRPIYDVHLLPEHLSLEVPDTFLEPGTLYELEILALEESGNQTIGLGYFMTET